MTEQDFSTTVVLGPTNLHVNMQVKQYAWDPIKPQRTLLLLWNMVVVAASFYFILYPGIVFFLTLATSGGGMLSIYVKIIWQFNCTFLINNDMISKCKLVTPELVKGIYSSGVWTHPVTSFIIYYIYFHFFFNSVRLHYIWSVSVCFMWKSDWIHMT